VAAAALASLFALPNSAVASGPERVPWGFTFEFTDTSICGFEVLISARLSGVDLEFYDDAGHLTRIQEHIAEQDTFTANGTVLVGEPYTFSASLAYSEAGDPIREDVQGGVEKVRLPDGSLLIAAGRTDYLTFDGNITVVPQHGASKNVDAFCAALSG
jgi:hypothetical protein